MSKLRRFTVHSGFPNIGTLDTLCTVGDKSEHYPWNITSTMRIRTA